MKVKAEVPMAGHEPVYYEGGWTCGVCGKRSRTHAAALLGDCPGKLVAAEEAHHSHALHLASFGPQDAEVPLVLCTKCGAHGAHKAVNLAKLCPAAAGGTAEKKATYRKQAALVAKGLHPSARGKVVLNNLRPLVRGPRRPGADGTAFDEAPVAPPAGTASGPRLRQRLLRQQRQQQQQQQQQPRQRPSQVELDPEGPAPEGQPTLEEVLDGGLVELHNGGEQHEEQDEEEDLFGHEGLGAAAYAPAGPCAVAVSQDAVATEREPPSEQPQCKKARTASLHVVSIAASLEGLEARLAGIGEAPRFVAVQPGRLQHACSTAEAWVNFWPSSLKWNVEGRQCRSIEDALLAPAALDEEMQPS